MTSPDPQAVKLEHKPQYRKLPGTARFSYFHLDWKQGKTACADSYSFQVPHHSKIQNRESKREQASQPHDPVAENEYMEGQLSNAILFNQIASTSLAATHFLHPAQ